MDRRRRGDALHPTDTVRDDPGSSTVYVVTTGGARPWTQTPLLRHRLPPLVHRHWSQSWRGWGRGGVRRRGSRETRSVLVFGSESEALFDTPTGGTEPDSPEHYTADTNRCRSDWASALSTNRV